MFPDGTSFAVKTKYAEDIVNEVARLGLDLDLH